MPESNMSILVVEDENIVAVDVQDRLVRLGYDVAGHSSTGQGAIDLARETLPDLVLMDIMLKGKMDGVEAAEEIKKFLDIPVIFLTAYTDTITLQRAKLTQPFGYLLKPFEERELHSSIEMAFYRHRLEKDLRDSTQWLNTVLNSIADAVVASDADGKVSFLNPRAEELLWKTHEDCIGRDLWDVVELFHCKDSVAVKDRLPSPFTSSECYLKSVDGRQLLVEYTASPILDRHGNVSGRVVVLRDITARKHVEQERE